MIRLGCVPYLNAKPLLWGLRDRSDVEVMLAVPSQLPALMEDGVVDAILVSSIEALRRPDLRVVPGIGIGSTGPVWSVRLFHPGPLAEIETLCLDQSSMTSNALALYLLRDEFDVNPRTMIAPPELAEMLRLADAAIVIGDRGMAEPPSGVNAWDLGEAWTELTGLPFVWAVWLARPDAPAEHDKLLQDSARAGVEAIDDVAQAHAAEAGFEVDFAERYLREAIEFEFSERHRAGFARFAEALNTVESATGPR